MLPQFTMQEILNVLEDKVGWEYMIALKDHLENMKDENDKRVEAIQSELNAQENYDYAMRGDFQDVVEGLNKLNEKPRVTRKEINCLTRQANRLYNNY
jgi:hypothetical protein